MPVKSTLENITRNGNSSKQKFSRQKLLISQRKFTSTKKI